MTRCPGNPGEPECHLPAGHEGRHCHYQTITLTPEMISAAKETTFVRLMRGIRQEAEAEIRKRGKP